MQCWKPYPHELAPCSTIEHPLSTLLRQGRESSVQQRVQHDYSRSVRVQHPAHLIARCSPPKVLPTKSSNIRRHKHPSTVDAPFQHTINLFVSRGPQDHASLTAGVQGGTLRGNCCPGNAGDAKRRACPSCRPPDLPSSCLRRGPAEQSAQRGPNHY